MPTGVAVDIDTIFTILNNIADILYTVGFVLAGITIVGAGIFYLTSGSDSQRVGRAKSMLKAGIIGTLVILSAGVIVSTISNFTSDPGSFFNSDTLSCGDLGGSCVQNACAVGVSFGQRDCNAGSVCCVLANTGN